MLIGRCSLRAQGEIRDHGPAGLSTRCAGLCGTRPRVLGTIELAVLVAVGAVERIDEVAARGLGLRDLTVAVEVERPEGELALLIERRAAASCGRRGFLRRLALGRLGMRIVRLAVRFGLLLVLLLRRRRRRSR